MSVWHIDLLDYGWSVLPVGTDPAWILLSLVHELHVTDARVLIIPCEVPMLQLNLLVCSVGALSPLGCLWVLTLVALVGALVVAVEKSYLAIRVTLVL